MKKRLIILVILVLVIVVLLIFGYSTDNEKEEITGNVILEENIIAENAEEPSVKILEKPTKEFIKEEQEEQDNLRISEELEVLKKENKIVEEEIQGIIQEREENENLGYHNDESNRIIIDECNVVINENNAEVILTNNLNCEKDGIIINSDNVNLICENNTKITGNLNRVGIYIIGNYNTVQNCYVEGFHYGIKLHSSSNNLILQNTLTNNDDHGIHLHHSDDNTISENIINTNNAEGLYLFYSSNNKITKNIITNNEDQGLLLSYSLNNEIFQNRVSNNKDGGIYLDSLSNNNLVEENIICNNKYFDIDDEYDNLYRGNICDLKNSESSVSCKPCEQNQG